MQLWKINFSGHFPVGAVAVSHGATKSLALHYFKQELARTEPDLVKKNLDLTEDDVKPFSLGFTGCWILNNGDY